VFSGSNSATVYYDSNYSGWSSTIAGRPASQFNTLTFILNGNSSGYSVSDCVTTASGSLNIPTTYNSIPVTSIGDNAFRNCPSLISITIPDSVTSIGSSAFYTCTGLISITIPDSVTSIGDWVFNNCSSLASITIPDSVTSIGSRAFRLCTSLTSITIPDSVTSIGDYAFNNCTGLTNITIPDSVTSIGDYAFRNCPSLISITIPDGVTSLGSSVFRECSSLASITIPDGVTSLGSSAFRSCTSLTSITFEGDAPAVSWLAFNSVFSSVNQNAVIYHYNDATGFTSPTWQGIQTEAISRPATTIASIEKSEGGVNLSFNSASGQIYIIESSNDLDNWTMLEDGIIGEGETVIRYYNTGGTQKRFYRVKRND